MLKYLFMGSPPFARAILQKLCEELYPPAAIITQAAKAAGRGRKMATTAVESYAREEELNLFSVLDVNAPLTVEALRSFDPDLMLVAAFGQILKNDLLRLPKLFCLNVHASLLPKYRGAAPIQRAILDGERSTGITIQKMARKLDTGEILLQREVPIGPDETSGELTGRLAVLGGECLLEAVRAIEGGGYHFTPQEESQATYAAKIGRQDAVLDWRRSAQQILSQIRALQPWPVAETTLGGERLKIFKAAAGSKAAGRAPGEILTDSRGFLAVACGDAETLTLAEIQLENRKRMTVREFLNSYRGSFPHKEVG